jgi:RHS repeat-associated protein
MKNRLERRYGFGHLHFITCSCYRRLPLFRSVRRRDLLLYRFYQYRLQPGPGTQVVAGARPKPKDAPFANPAKGCGTRNFKRQNPLSERVRHPPMHVENATQVSPFRVIRSKACSAFANYEGPFVSIDVLLSWGTSRFGWVTTVQDVRQSGESNYTFFRLVSHALTMMTGFSTWPLRLASLVGFVFTFFGVVVLVYVVGRYFVAGGSVPGFPFLASVIAIFSGAQLFALGVIGYDALGRRTSLNRPNGVNTSYAYDNLSRLLSVLHQVGGSTIDGASYTYDAAGNRTSKTVQPSGLASSYAYDPAYQLTQVMQGATQTEAYTYDAVGNRTYQPGAPYTYNTSNEMLTREGAPYTYDANGNTLSHTNGGGTTSYTWDFENRLTGVTLVSGGAVAFKYDPFGRRIYHSTPSGTTIYLYDGNNIIDELNATGVVQERYTYGPGTDEPLVGQRQPKIFYYEADGLGSVTSLTDPTGAVAATYTYNSFGFLTSSTGSATNWFRYTARQFDSETALYYYRARYYDPVSGRFLSEDPMRFSAGVNFYPYVQNNPINLVDPLGLCEQQKCTELQQAAANLAKFLDTTSSESGWIATGTGIGTVFAGVGEGLTFGFDTPVTITFGSLTGFFGTTSLVTGAGAAALNSFAGGNTTALQNFEWSQLANLAAKAAATGIPLLKPWADTIGDLAEQGADLSVAAAEACN